MADTFEERLINNIENVILNEINKGSFISVGYGHKYTVPDSLIQECYQKVDTDKVKALITEKIEELIAKTVVNSLTTELTNDVKKLMSTKNIREDLQYYLRQQMEKGFNSITTDKD